jgi:preprotein translocase subunit SecG
MIITILTIFHVLACLFLIIVVLLQHGKSADIAAAFGGMGSQTAFGPRSAANIMTKITTACAVIFMLTSITLSILATRRTGTGGSVLSDEKPAQTQPAPPAKQPPAPPSPAK